MHDVRCLEKRALPCFHAAGLKPACKLPFQQTASDTAASDQEETPTKNGFGEEGNVILKRNLLVMALASAGLTMAFGVQAATGDNGAQTTPGTSQQQSTASNNNGNGGSSQATTNSKSQQ